MVIPFVSMRFHDSTIPGTHNMSGAFRLDDRQQPSINSSCPPGWTNERCRRRQDEFGASLQIHEQIRNEMEDAARQRAQRDEYLVNRPEQLEAEHNSYVRKVQQALGGSTASSTATTNATNNNLPFGPWANFSHNSFADLSILGFPKAGTSQLFNLLVSHPQAEPVFKRKEFCMDHGHFLDYTLPQQLNNPNALRNLRKNLFGYHNYMLQKRSEPFHKSQQQFVNACLQPREMEYHLFYTPIPETSKFILLFRDPADWLWASWNFWIDKNLDDRRAVDHDWATLGVHYRSPELFHELILSQESTKSAAKRFRTMRENTVHVPRRLLHFLGKDRVLFLKSEQMKATSGNLPQFLDLLGKFTGLLASGFNATVAHGHTNCNAQKGFRSVCAASGKAPSGYPITHHRPMLDETRNLIYIQFWEECKIWKSEFGIIYQECIDAVTT
jgi:Sulfotransferase domain